MKSIEETTIRINSIRQKGGSYTGRQLSNLLEGYPYKVLLPRIMKRHPKIIGYSVEGKYIVFDTHRSINIKAIELFIKEAKEYQVDMNKRCSNKILSIKEREDIISKCLDLYFSGKSNEVCKLIKKLKK